MRRVPFNMRPLAHDARYCSAFQVTPAAPAPPRTWRDLNKAQLRALLYFNDGNADLDDATKGELIALAEFWEAEEADALAYEKQQAIEAEAAGKAPRMPEVETDFLNKMMRGEWNRSAHVPAMLAALAGRRG